MFDLIHTYIHVLLKNKKNNFFVDNFVGIKEYIDTGPSYRKSNILEEELEYEN